MGLHHAPAKRNSTGSFSGLTDRAAHGRSSRWPLPGHTSRHHGACAAWTCKRPADWRRKLSHALERKKQPVGLTQILKHTHPIKCNRYAPRLQARPWLRTPRECPQVEMEPPPRCLGDERRCRHHCHRWRACPAHCWGAHATTGVRVRQSH